MKIIRTFTIALVFTWLSLLVGLTSAFARQPLLRNALPNFSVSGISAGAFMATQMGVAYSDKVEGMASLSGGIYYCAEGDVNQALGNCMKTPQNLSVQKYIQYAKKWESEGKISSLALLANKPLYVLHGTQDTVIAPTASVKLVQFFQQFQSKITFRNTIQANHGFLSPLGTVACNTAQSPWLNKCVDNGNTVDSAGELLTAIYGPLKTPARGVLPQGFMTLDQTDSGDPQASMAASGVLYIPKACRVSKAACKWHVAFHGCKQGPEFVGNEFFTKSNYAAWAEANNIIVMFPVVSTSLMNPNGCWDWWGYSGPNFAQRTAPQMLAVLQLLQRTNQSLR